MCSFSGGEHPIEALDADRLGFEGAKPLLEFIAVIGVHDEAVPALSGGI